LIFVVQASLVTVEQSERGMGAGQGFEGQGQSNTFVDVLPSAVDIFALFLHFGFEETGLDAGITGQAPVGGGELVDEVGFGLVGGSEVVEVVAKFGLIFFLRLVGKDDGFRRKAVFHGIERGGATAVFSLWAARFGSVQAGSFGSGRHMGSWRECSWWSEAASGGEWGSGWSGRGWRWGGAVTGWQVGDLPYLRAPARISASA
jgi:hypothetical protein